MPAKFFPAPTPYGASPASNVLNPTQPAAQNAQQPLLPPNFIDPGKMAAQAQSTPLGQVSSNPFAGGGGSDMRRLFGRGLF